MNELIYPKNNNWPGIYSWINDNSKGNVVIDTMLISKFHSGYVQDLRYTSFLVRFSDESDALICKIKFPPTEQKQDHA